MHYYIQDSCILTLSYPGFRLDQLGSKLEDIAITIIILSPGCQQPFLIKMASDNRLSAAIFGPKWLVTTGCQQPLPNIYVLCCYLVIIYLYDSYFREAITESRDYFRWDLCAKKHILFQKAPLFCQEGAILPCKCVGILIIYCS